MSYYTSNFTKPTKFIKKYLDKNNLFISNKRVGIEVYNIKTPNFKQDIGYIGYFKDNNKVTSLLTYLNNIAIKKRLRNYILILSNIKDNINYYYIGYKGDLEDGISFYNKKDIRSILLVLLKKEGFKFNSKFINSNNLD
jgi:hypothetical protein